MSGRQVGALALALLGHGVRLVCAGMLVIVLPYTVIAAVVAVLTLSGELTPGGVMFFDLHTPKLWKALAFVAMGIACTASLYFWHWRIGQGLEDRSRRLDRR